MDSARAARVRRRSRPAGAARWSSAAICAASCTATPARRTAAIRSQQIAAGVPGRRLSVRRHHRSFARRGLRRRPVGRRHSPSSGTRSTRSTPTLPGFRVLKGIESDILADGTLDYPDDVLAGFDFVIGSIHSRFNLARDEMTERVCRAMDSPYLTILGHPTGRLLLSREPYPIDLDRVFATAAERRRRDRDQRRSAPPRPRLARAGRSARARRDDLDRRRRAQPRRPRPTSTSASASPARAASAPTHILNCRDVDGFLAFARARRRVSRASSRDSAARRTRSRDPRALRRARSRSSRGSSSCYPDAHCELDTATRISCWSPRFSRPSAPTCASTW